MRFQAYTTQRDVRDVAAVHHAHPLIHYMKGKKKKKISLTKYFSLPSFPTTRTSHHDRVPRASGVVLYLVGNSSLAKRVEIRFVSLRLGRSGGLAALGPVRSLRKLVGCL